MKKILLLALMSLSLLTKAQKRIANFSLAGEGACMATEQAFSVYNLGFGGSGKFLFPTGKKNYFTGTLEVMAFSGRSGNPSDVFGTSLPVAGVNIAHPSLTLIVPKVGYKYFFNKKFNTEVEAGYCIASVKKLFESIRGNIGGYDFTLGFGFLVNKKLDIGLRYEQFESTAADRDFTSFVALRAMLNIDFK